MAVLPAGKRREQRPGPWYYDTPMGVYEWIKVWLMILSGILFLRIILLAIIIGFIQLYASMAKKGATTNKDGMPDPLPPDRARHVRRIQSLCGWALSVLGYRIEIEGDPCVLHKDRPRIIVSNHVSSLDPIVLWTKLGVPAAVAKDTHWKSLFGKVLDATQSIPIDRVSKESKEMCRKRIQYQASDNRFRPVLVFPQGTCTNSHWISWFKNGAFEPGMPILPVSISYPNSHFMVADTFPSRWDRTMLRTFCQVYITCKIKFLPIYYPNSAEKQDMNLYAKNVGDTICKSLRAVRTKHEVYDMILYEKANDDRFNFARKHPVEVGDFTRFNDWESGVPQCSFEQMLAMLRRFRKIDSNKSGFIEPGELFSALGVTSGSDLASMLFDYFEEYATVKGQRRIEFDAFAWGVLHIAGQKADPTAEEMAADTWPLLSKLAKQALKTPKGKTAWKS